LQINFTQFLNSEGVRLCIDFVFAYKFLGEGLSFKVGTRHADGFWSERKMAFIIFVWIQIFNLFVWCAFKGFPPFDVIDGQGKVKAHRFTQCSLSHDLANRATDSSFWGTESAE